MDIPELTFALIVRVSMVLLGLGALFCLWIARRDRSEKWSSKLHDIWMCHMIAALGIVQSNFEFLLRENETKPTWGVVLFMAFLVWTIKSTLNGDTYVKEESCSECKPAAPSSPRKPG